MPFLLLAASTLAAGTPTEPRTSAAVIAADDRWEAAELSGDSSYLQQLLADGYVSVGADGKITTKAQIVEKARRRTAADKARLARLVASWRASHPVHADVVIEGETAVLRWTTPASLVSSSDIFIYAAGHWRAAYSQHTAVSN